MPHQRDAVFGENCARGYGIALPQCAAEPSPSKATCNVPPPTHRPNARPNLDWLISDANQGREV
ncbi:MAG: hypothetical protein WBV28_06170 [Terracidiphilus sp.]